MEFDVFLSYVWNAHKTKVHDLNDVLVAKNYKTWIDKTEMIQGDIGQNMFDGITKSKVFMCCLTKEYVERPNAMKELNLAVGIQKSIVWVIVEDVGNMQYKDILLQFGYLAIHLAQALFYKVNDIDQITNGIERILNTMNINNSNNITSIGSNLTSLPRYLPKLPLNNFIEGRVENEKLFKYLDEHFKKENKVIISGLPGIGKSTNAMQYAYSSDCIARWIYAETVIKIDESFRELAKLLLVSEWETKQMRILITDVAAAICKLEKKCLIIFDNVEEYTDIEQFLVGITQNVYFIVTTRNKKLHNGIKTVTLEPFTKEEGLVYMKHYLNDSGFTDDEVEKVLDTEIQNGQIIAYRAEHIAAFLQNNNILELQTLLTEVKKSNVNEIETKLIEKIRNQSKESFEIVQCAAFLSPDNITIKHLNELTGQTITQLAKNLSILNKLAFISTSTIDRKKVLIHRLTQSLIQRSLSEKETEGIIEQISKYINEHLPYTSEIPDHTWEQAKDCIQHAEALFQQNKNQTNSKIFAEISFKIANYYQHRMFDYKKAIQFYGESIEMYNKIYKNDPHPDIAMSLNNIGLAYNSIGDSKNALKYHAESLEMRKKIYKNDPHPDIAMSLNNIGLAYDSIGDSQNALKYYAESLEMRKKIYKNDPHPDIATSLNNIGGAYNSIGDSQNALIYFSESLEMYKKIYKNDQHPDIATSLNNIGMAYNSIGDSQNALKYYAESLEMYKKIYKNDPHPDIATSLNNIGGAYNSIGDSQNAFKYYAESLEMYKKYIKMSHILTLQRL